MLRSEILLERVEAVTEGDLVFESFHLIVMTAGRKPYDVLKCCLIKGRVDLKNVGTSGIVPEHDDTIGTREPAA